MPNVPNTPGPNNISEPWSFGDVQTMHEMAKSRDANFRQMSLPQFAQHMNEQTGSTRFNAGLSSGLGGMIKQTETGLEQNLQPVSQWSGEQGARLGGLIGPKTAEVGREVGEGIPRQAVTMAPLIAAGAVGGPIGLGLTAAGLGSQAAETYTHTGSPLAAAISAGSLPLMGKLGEVGAERLMPLAERLGSTVENMTSPLLGAVAKGGVREVGRTVGEVAAMESANQAESVTMGQGLYNPLTLKHAVDTLASVLPYKALDVPKFVSEVRADTSSRNDAATTAALGVHNSFEAGLEAKETAAATTARRAEGYHEAEQFNLPFKDDPKIQSAVDHFAATSRAKFVPATPFGTKTEEETGGGTQTPFGLKPTPTPEGPKLPGNTLLQKMPTVLPKDEWELLKGQGIEGFLKNNRVSQQELNTWVKENGPRVEVRKAGQGAQTPEMREQVELTHWKDTIEPRLSKAIDDLGSTHEVVISTKTLQQAGILDKAKRYNELLRTQLPFTRDTYWQSIAPKPESQMPGYVEGAVIVHPPTHESIFAKNHQTILFPSYHSFPPNTLGFFRGYMETSPEGKKTFHVVEVQSDWMKRVREENQQEGDGKHGRMFATPQHPLLQDYERLTLKAAIHHALGEGADSIALSDSETARMTEKHDQVVSQARAEVEEYNSNSRNTNPKNTLNNLNSNYKKSGAKFEGTSIGKIKMVIEPYSVGMPLHYDQSIPSILRQLTGYEGKPVSFGEHKNAIQDQGIGAVERQPRADLIFKNAEGQPKTDISARSYPLNKAYKYLQEQGGYHLMSKNKINAHLADLARKDVPVDQLAQAGQNLQHLPLKPGENLYDAAAREAGLDPTKLKDPTHLLSSIEAFGKTIYKALGYDEQHVGFLTRNLQDVAKRFAPSLGGTRVVESTDANFATVPRGERWKPIIGLVKDIGFGDPLYDHFGRLWSLGHELTHQMEFAAAAKDPMVPEEHRLAYLDALEKSKLLDPREKQESIAAMIRGLTGDRAFAEDAAQFYGEYYKDPDQGNAEYVADFAGLVAMGAAHSKGTANVGDLMFFGNKETQGFIGTMVKTLSQLFEPLAQLARRLVGKNTPIDDIYQATNKMLARKSEADAALNGFLAWADRFQHQVGDPPMVTSYEQIERWRERVEGFDDHAAKTMWPFTSKKEADPDLRKEAEAAMSRVVAGGKKLSMWQQLIPMRQLVKEVPAFSPAVDLAHVKDSMAKELLLGLWQPFSDPKSKKIDTGLVRSVGREGSPLNSAFNKIALLENEKKAVLTPEERQPLLAKLSPENRSKVERFYQAKQVAVVQAGHILVEHQKLRHIATVAKVAQSYLKATDMEGAETIGRNYVNMVFNQNPVPGEDPVAAQERMQAYTEAVKGVNQHGLPPETSSSLIDLAQGLYESQQGFTKQMLGEDLQGKPWYNSETRPREFHVAFQGKDGQPHYEDFDTAKEAQGRIDGLQKVGIKPQSFRKSDLGQRFQSLPTDMLNAYKQADDLAYNSALKHLSESDPDYPRFAEELKTMFQPGEGAAAQRTSPFLRERKMVAGRERLNMVETMIHYLGSVAHSRAKTYVADRMGLALNSPGLRDNNNYYNAARTYLQETVSPQGREYTKLKNMVFLNYLGFNPSSNMIVFLHQALRHAPELVRQGFGVGEAYSAMGKSFLTVGKARLDKGYADTELGNAVANARGLLDRSQASEIYNEEDLSRLNVHALIEGKGPINDAKALMSNGLYMLTKAARSMYGVSTEFNSEAAFVSAYQLAKGRGADATKAQKFAEDTIKITTIPGGVANRPLELQGLGKMRGEGGLFYNLMSYEMGAVASMGRYVRESIGSLPTESRGASMKAAGLMMGTQVLMGGVLGLPFVDGLISIVDNLFPQAQVRKNLRQSFQSLVPNDDKLGHIVADGAMRGGLSLGALGLGTRLELGKLFNVDPKTGKWDMSEELLGPMGSLINSWTKAVQFTGQGRFDQAAVAASPNGIKGLLKMYVDDGAMRDPQSRMVLQPSTGEKVLEGLGFRTRRMQDYYEEQQLKAQSEMAASNELQQFHREMGKRLLQGDFEGVRSEILGRQRSSPPGTFDALASAKASVQSAQDQSIPVDPTRSGSRQSAAQLSSIGQLYDRPEVPSETQRLQQKVAMTARLGVPGTMSISPTEFRQALMVDLVMKQNPTISRVEALKMVERMMQPKQAVLGYGSQWMQQASPR